MKKIIDENKKLPLIFNYVATIKKQQTTKNVSSLRTYIECQKLQTDYLIRSKSYKSITRLL